MNGSDTLSFFGEETLYIVYLMRAVQVQIRINIIQNDVHHANKVIFYTLYSRKIKTSVELEYI